MNVIECKWKYSHLNSLNTIGYKEIFKYFTMKYLI